MKREGAGTAGLWKGKGMGVGWGGVVVVSGWREEAFCTPYVSDWGWKAVPSDCETEGVPAPCNRGCCSVGVAGTGSVENKPIRKQVPADSPMRCIGWDPVGPGGEPALSGRG